MGIWVGRYAMAGGEPREHGPWLVERERPHEGGTVRLIVLAEPLDERSGEFCHDVADAVASLFGREPLSITGGLQQALRRAHENLSEWNRRSLREHRVAVGLTCLAVRGTEVTLAQAGPGAVYVADGDGVRCLNADGETASRPVGGLEPVALRFRTLTLDRAHLLLLTSAAEAAAGREAVVAAVEAGPERALAELFARTVGVSDMTAVIVADLANVEDAPLPPAASASEDADAEAFATASAPPEVRVDSGPPPFAGTARRRALPSLRRPQAGAMRGGGGVRLPWRWMAVAAVLLAAAVLAGFVALPALLDEGRGERLEAALAAAGAELDAAAAAEGDAERRRLLESAAVEVSRARAVDAEDPRLATLDARVAAEIVRLDAVVEVAGLRPLLAFEGSVTAPLEPAALVAGGGLLWLLDSAQGRVITVDLEGAGSPSEVYRSGAVYDGVIAGDPVAMTWEAAVGRLLVLDAGRSLFGLAPGAIPRPLALRDASDLRSAQAIAAYDGNLYVLDPEGGEVWRYLPAGEGYDSERTGLLGGAAIEQALLLAVDGDLFLLEEGALRHFRRGEELEPMLPGIDRPPSRPAGLVADRESGLLFVADGGGHRVIAAAREGAFLAQFRHTAFTDLRGLALAPGGESLYLLTGSGIVGFVPRR